MQISDLVTGKLRCLSHRQMPGNNTACQESTCAIYLDESIGSASSIFLSRCSVRCCFFTPGSAPFQCVDMSYILLRFMDKYIRGGNYNCFNLVSLSYKLGPSGTFGVLLFDERLRTAYHQARVRARASQNSFRC
jgi:hypothetical protein